MGEDTVDAIINYKLLPKSESTSEDQEIYNGNPKSIGASIHPALPYTWSDLEHCIAHEWVEHAEDLLCRRTRCMLLHKEATLDILDKAIDLIADHHGYDVDWKKLEKERFLEVSEAY